MLAVSEGQQRRILRVRETQKRIALGRLAEAARTVEAIDRRGVLLGRLIDDTVPCVQPCRGADLIGRMRFVARLQGAQVSLGSVRADAATAHSECSTGLRDADSRVDIATRMVDAQTALNAGQAQRQSLEDLYRQAKQSGKGQP